MDSAFPSLLDKDDLNGPSVGNFPRSTSFAIDYGLYKISIYYSLENVNDKIKFIKDIDSLILQLGKNRKDEIFQLFSIMVKTIQVNDNFLVKKEFTKMIPKIVQIFSSMDYSLIKQFIPILETLLDSDLEILRILSNIIKTVSEMLNNEDRNKWLLTNLLKITHDEDYEKKKIGIKMISSIIETLETEVCQIFILPDILALSQSESYKMIVAEVIPTLAKCLKSLESLDLMINVFLSLCNDPNSEIREVCASNFHKFSFCPDSTQIQVLQPCFKEMLKDKSDKVRYKALLQLGPLISYSGVPFPHQLLDNYLKLAKNAANDKELQMHCAFYFPGVFERMGKES